MSTESVDGLDVPKVRMRKEDLLAALEFHLSSYVYGILAPSFVPAGEWDRLARSRPVTPGTEEAARTAPLREDAIRVAKVLQDPAKRAALVEIHREGLKRALLAEAHEMILTYAVATGQFPLYQSAEFHDFARVLRAAMAVRAGGVLRAWPRDLDAAGVREVRWKNRVIAADAVGEPVAFSQMEALALFNDHLAFARETLR